MLLQQSEPQWTPASETEIQSLPTVVLTAEKLKVEENKLCPICQEDYRSLSLYSLPL